MHLPGKHDVRKHRGTAQPAARRNLKRATTHPSTAVVAKLAACTAGAVTPTVHAALVVAAGEPPTPAQPEQHKNSTALECTENAQSGQSYHILQGTQHRYTLPTVAKMRRTVPRHHNRPQSGLSVLIPPYQICSLFWISYKLGRIKIILSLIHI